MIVAVRTKIMTREHAMRDADGVIVKLEHKREPRCCGEQEPVR